MKQRLYNSFLLVCCFFCFALCSCNNDIDNASKAKVFHRKIVIIMPDAEKVRWHRIVDWAISDINAAQSGLPQQVFIDVSWLDEDSSDWQEKLKDCVNDDSFVAVVGPKKSINAQKAAEICDINDKTIILPIATSSEFQRMYAGRKFVWNLTQSDITQCQLLISQALLSYRSSVSLLTSDDFYGKSYINWFGFLATQLGINVDNIFIYHSDAELSDYINQISKYPSPSLRSVIFAPGNADDALVLDKLLCSLKEADSKFSFPSILCSDVVCNSAVLPLLKYGCYEGLAPSAAPESGFHAIYTAKFGEEPIAGEAHLYDALLLLAYSLSHQIANNSSLNESILDVVDARSPWSGSWLRDDLHSALSLILNHYAINLCGVTSDWSFDVRTHASVLNSSYNHWLFKNGKLTSLEFISTDGSINTISSSQAWEFQNQNMQVFNNNPYSFSYPDLKDRWAVIVGGSDDWINYRHQADALAMYQLLKRHGYDDQHIILIMEDNIANNTKNKYPGVVKVRPDGENLYVNVNVDYHISDLSPADLKDIMLGNASSRLHSVLSCGPADNVMFFWCGHGVKNNLAWGSHNQISASQIRDIISSMRNENKYRKLFFALDACYSGSIGEACTGIPGLLIFTAANSNEPSKTDMKDSYLGVWLSNGFTRSFQETIDANADITLRDLYNKVAQQTFGSHAMMFNFDYYGNAFKDSMSEFLSQ